MTRVTRLPRARRMAAGVTLGIAGIIGVAGCATGDGPEGSPPGTEPPDQLTGTLTVFAAASLTETFDRFATRLEEQHPGLEVVVNYGGSSALAGQIVQGAPADVFAAANEPTMQTVIASGDATAPAVFATNTLELVVPAGNPAGITGIADLADPGLAVALCDPSVPCGAAAETLLDAAGVIAVPDTLEEDVKAVLTKVELGEADAGLVYVTDVRSAGDAVEGIEVPEAAAAVNRYPIVVLGGAPNPRAAEAFLALVLSSEGRQVLADAGFGAP